MPLVIAHPKFLLDQMGHARAGPQRGFIAQPFWTLPQQGLQALPIFLAQKRLAPRPSGFAQRRLAVSTILLHPASYGLTNHPDLAGNGGLVLSAFEQANGFEAAFFQGIKIASHSSRVSHA